MKKKTNKSHLPNHTRWIHKTSWSPWASIVFANDFVLKSIHIVCTGSILVNGNFPSWWIIILAFCVLLLWMLLWRLRWLCRCLLIWLLTIAIFHQHGRKIHTIFVGQSFMFLIIVCKFEEKERSTNWNGQLQRNFCETKNSIESIVEFDLFEKRDFLISHMITKMEKKINKLRENHELKKKIDKNWKRKKKLIKIKNWKRNRSYLQ